MTNTGEIVDVNGNIATVKVVKTSACGHNCSECSVCNAPVIEAEAINTIGAKKGDRVVIETQSRDILKIAFFIYMLPVFIIVITAVLAKALMLKSGITVVAFLTMFVIWYSILKLCNNKKHEKNIIIKILP